MNELKPCPFCGGVAELLKSTECGGFGLYVEHAKVICVRCGATGARFSDFDYGKDVFTYKAIDAWNTRKEKNDETEE